MRSSVLTRLEEISEELDRREANFSAVIPLQVLFGGRICEERGTELHKWYTSGQRAYGIMLTLYVLLSPRRKQQIITATGRRGRVQGGAS